MIGKCGLINMMGENNHDCAKVNLNSILKFIELQYHIPAVKCY